MASSIALSWAWGAAGAAVLGREEEKVPRPPDPVPIAQPPGPAGGRDLTAKVGVQCGYRESPGDAAQEEWELRARKRSPWLS